MMDETETLDRTDEWIETASGGKFHFLLPDSDSIRIKDIAHALSMIVRYTGHCKEFYSVAEHSVLCADYLERQDHPERVQLIGLLHDAAEAYISDLSKPLKQFLPQYRILEKRIQSAIWKKFLTGPPDSAECQAVEYADAVLLATEAKKLMPSGGEIWTLPADADPERIVIHCWPWQETVWQFTHRFRTLNAAKG